MFVLKLTDSTDFRGVGLKNDSPFYINNILISGVVACEDELMGTYENGYRNGIFYKIYPDFNVNDYYTLYKKLSPLHDPHVWYKNGILHGPYLGEVERKIEIGRFDDGIPYGKSYQYDDINMNLHKVFNIKDGVRHGLTFNYSNNTGTYYKKNKRYLTVYYSKIDDSIIDWKYHGSKKPLHRLYYNTLMCVKLLITNFK